MRVKDWKFSGAGGAHVGLFGRSTIMMAPEKDKGGGGGDDDPDDDDDAAELPKDRKGWKKFIGSIVKGTVDGLEASNAKKRDKQTAKIVAEALKATGLVKGEGDEPDDPDKPDDDKEKAKDRDKDGKFKKGDEQNAAINAAKKAADDAKKIAVEERDKRIAAERRQQAQEEKSKLTSELSGYVRQEQLDDVVESLQKRIHRDPETDEILWKGDKWSDKEDADNSDNVMPFEDGLAKWKESAKGKSYAAPRNAGGGGSGRPPMIGGKGKDGKVEDASDGEIGALISRQTAR